MLKAVMAALKDALRIFFWPFKAMGSGLRSMALCVKKWGFTRFIKAIEPVAILIAIFAFAIEMSDRREERTARAWQLVTTKANGNSGKNKLWSTSIPRVIPSYRAGCRT